VKKKDLLIVSLLFFVWRIFLFIPPLLSLLIPLKNKYVFPLSIWGNFDGVHYLNIAGNGYTNNARFMPFYPFIIKLLSFLTGQTKAFGQGQFIIGFLLNNIFFLLSLFILFKLIKLDFPKNITLPAIISVLVFPTSFFFGAVYSEGLFLLLILLSFYFARQKNWLLAGIFACLSSATRIVGIIMFFALLLEFYLQKEKINFKKFIFICIAPVGTITYAIYNKIKWGNFFYFLQAHGELGNSRSTNKIVLFPQTIYRYLKILLTLPTKQFEWWIALLELTMFIFCLSILYIAWRKKVRLSYLLYSLGALFIPALSGTFSGLPRYIIPIFPMFLGISLIKNKIFRIIYIAISVILSTILLMFFSRGYFIA